MKTDQRVSPMREGTGMGTRCIGMGLGATAGLLVGLLLATGTELPAQETEADPGAGRRSSSAGDGPSPGHEPGRAWQVVAAEGDIGVVKAKFLLYNVRTGESYALHNGADRWVALPFVEGEAGAVQDSSRVNLKRFNRQGATFLPFSAVLEEAQREARKKGIPNKAAPER